MGQLKNTTSIYLKFGSTKIRIPVNPEEIEIKYPSNNKKQDIIGVGEVVVQKRPGLEKFPGKAFSLARIVQILISIRARKARSGMRSRSVRQ